MLTIVCSTCKRVNRVDLGSGDPCFTIETTCAACLEKEALEA